MTARLAYAPLTAETAPLLAASDVLDDPADPDWLEGFLADPGHLMELALNDGRVIGFASGTILRHPDKPPTLFVNEVGVDPAHRRRGIGAHLTRRLLQRARTQGAHTAWLATEADNVAARALYKKLGARETGDIVIYDWNAVI